MRRPVLVLCWYEAVLVDGFGPRDVQSTIMVEVENSAHIETALERRIKLELPGRTQLRSAKLLKYRPSNDKPRF